MEKAFEQISIAAKNYADALIQLGQDGILPYETILSDLGVVENAIHNSSDLQKVLSNPSFNEDVKIDILTSIFDKKINSNLLNFLKILVQKDRIGEFGEIYADFINRLNKIKNIQPVTVVSAIELKPDYKRQIIEKLSTKLGKTVQPEWNIDKKIIAGITVKIDDNVIDMSLKNRIETLSKNLLLK